jgi:hypothetical protein
MPVSPTNPAGFSIPGSTTHVLGTLPIPSGRVLITDPGYEIMVGELLKYPDGSLCNTILECVPGNYEVRYTKTGQVYWNLDSLGIFHTDHKTVQPNEMTDCVLASDGASMSFSDANHKVPLFEFLKDHSVDRDRRLRDFGLVDWQGTRVAYCNRDGSGYPLLVARDPEGRIIAAEVLFEYNEDYFDDGE